MVKAASDRLRRVPEDPAPKSTHTLSRSTAERTKQYARWAWGIVVGGDDDTDSDGSDSHNEDQPNEVRLGSQDEFMLRKKPSRVAESAVVELGIFLPSVVVSFSVATITATALPLPRSVTSVVRMHGVSIEIHSSTTLGFQCTVLFHSIFLEAPSFGRAMPGDAAFLRVAELRGGADHDTGTDAVRPEVLRAELIAGTLFRPSVAAQHQPMDAKPVRTARALRFNWTHPPAPPDKNTQAQGSAVELVLGHLTSVTDSEFIAAALNFLADAKLQSQGCDEESDDETAVLDDRVEHLIGSKAKETVLPTAAESDHREHAAGQNAQDRANSSDVELLVHATKLLEHMAVDSYSVNIAAITLALTPSRAERGRTSGNASVGALVLEIPGGSCVFATIPNPARAEFDAAGALIAAGGHYANEAKEALETRAKVTASGARICLSSLIGHTAVPAGVGLEMCYSGSGHELMGDLDIQLNVSCLELPFAGGRCNQMTLEIPHLLFKASRLQLRAAGALVDRGLSSAANVLSEAADEQGASKLEVSLGALAVELTETSTTRGFDLSISRVGLSIETPVVGGAAKASEVVAARQLVLAGPGSVVEDAQDTPDTDGKIQPLLQCTCQRPSGDVPAPSPLICSLRLRSMTGLFVPLVAEFVGVVDASSGRASIGQSSIKPDDIDVTEAKSVGEQLPKSQRNKMRDILQSAVIRVDVRILSTMIPCSMC